MIPRAASKQPEKSNSVCENMRTWEMKMTEKNEKYLTRTLILRRRAFEDDGVTADEDDGVTAVVDGTDEVEAD
jgi:hypothetical protein